MKRGIVVLVSSLLFVGGLSAQRVFRMGLRGSYRTIDVFELPHSHPNHHLDKTTTFIKQGDIGLLFRFNIGDHFYIQPEVGVRPNTQWDSIDRTGDFFQQWGQSLSSATSTSISVPLMVGWRLFSLSNLMTMRVFAGPEFYTEVGAKGPRQDWSTYSFCGGVGIDLIDLLYVDLRAAYNKRIAFDAPPTYYSLTFGIIF